MRIIIAFLLSCLSVTAATNIWYIDDITSGANDGTSWANAWRNFSSINWSSIGAGDMIWVSGGRYTNNSFRVPSNKAGTQSQPIIFKASQEVGHSDLVDFVGTIGGYSNATWIIFDGAKSDSVAAALTNTLDVPSVVPTNCNWRITNNIASAVVGYGSKGCGNNITMRWIELGPNISGVNDQHAVFFNSTYVSNNIIEYCYIHDIEADGVQVSGQSIILKHDLVTVRWSYFLNIGDDVIESQPGITVNNNYFQMHTKRHNHPDGMAGPVGFAKYYNNVYVDMQDRPFYLLRWEGSDSRIHDDIYVVGNLMFIDQKANPPLKDNPEAGILLGWETQRPWYPTNWPWSNIFICNNTIIGNGLATTGQIHQGIVWANANSNITTNIMWNVHVYNNMMVDMPNGTMNAKGATTGYEYTPSRFRYDFNLSSTTNSLGAGIVYQGTTFVNAVTFNNGTSFDNNTTNRPVFVNRAGHDYRLASTDTAAKDAGTNLSSLGVFGITNDMRGVVRGADGNWDIGAFEYEASTATLGISPSSRSVSCLTNNDASASTYTLYCLGDTSTTVTYTNRQSTNAWFSISLSNGTVSSEVDTNVITFDTDWLSAGSYVGYVTNSGYTNGVLINNQLLTISLSLTNSPASTNAVGTNVTDSLVVWFTFEDDFTNNMYVTDWSWTGHEGNFYGDDAITNWPSQVSTDGTPGRNVTNLCAEFTWVDSDWYNDREGDFVAIDNMWNLTNMGYATIMVWGRYYQMNTNATNRAADIRENQATFLDAGTSGDEGGWALGSRYYGFHSHWLMITNSAAGEPRALSNFPDDAGQNSDTTNWHHYCAVFSNGVSFTYFDGTNLATMAPPGGVTTLSPRTYSGNNLWIGLGCWTHNGDPELRSGDPPDHYPANGWLHGVMDEVRIYNRVLTPFEIANVYSYTGGTNSVTLEGVGGGGETPAQTNQVRSISMRGKVAPRGKVTFR